MPKSNDPGVIATALAPFRTAILATRGDGGHLRARPMAMRHALRGEEIWFATAADSAKCRDIERDARCALVFFDSESGTTVSVSGQGEVIRDRKLTASLWDRSWDRWVPGAIEPSEVVLLRVIPHLVERHDGATGRVEVIFQAPQRGA
jgi:general stress protein 26